MWPDIRYNSVRDVQKPFHLASMESNNGRRPHVTLKALSNRKVQYSQWLRWRLHSGLQLTSGDPNGSEKSKVLQMTDLTDADDSTEIKSWFFNQSELKMDEGLQEYTEQVHLYTCYIYTICSVPAATVKRLSN